MSPENRILYEKLERKSSDMKIGIRFEKRDYGSGKLTWRMAPPIICEHGRSPCVGVSVRQMSNRQAKKMGLVFGDEYVI